MRVNIISRDNGWGLSRDMAVLRDAIVAAGDHIVTGWDYQDTNIPSADVNVMLELVAPHAFARAYRNIFVPNPEWFFADRWTVHLPKFDEVWGKTDDACCLFAAMHRNVVKSGWTSRDMKLGSSIIFSPPQREPLLLHVAGASPAKGTAQVLEVMRRRSDLSLLMVVSKERQDVTPNVHQVTGLGDGILAFHMHQCAVHLCPSSYEGFGHTINESRSNGALIITTNAPPMNELVTAEFGIGVPWRSTSRQRMATHYHVDVDELEKAIDLALSMPPETIDAVGAKARAAYLAGRNDFHRFIASSFA